MKALAFGEVLWDIFENDKHIGGAPLNFCAHFKKCGGESWILTAVGNDQLGKETVCEIEKLGVDTSLVSTVPYQTGKCLVTLNEQCIPFYDLLSDVAYDYIQRPSITSGFFDILYFGTLALRSENNLKVLKEIVLNNTFKEVFVDLNIRSPFYSEQNVKFAFENATILKVSDEELPTVMDVLKSPMFSLEDSAKMLYEAFPNLKMIIITQGGEGSLVFDCESNEFYKAKANDVKVVSTVGAGDSFSASFLAVFLKSGDIQKALEFATEISGYVVSCEEAIPHYEFKF